MTFAELLAKIKANMKEEPEKPVSYHKLMEQNLAVLLQQNRGYKELTVYENGLAVYSDYIGGKMRHTVFSVKDMVWTYQYVTGSRHIVHVNDNPDMLRLDAAKIIMIYGESRLENNTSSREDYHAKGSLDINGNHYEAAQDTVKREQEFIVPDFSDAIVDAIEQEERKKLGQKALRCLDRLTPNQKEVVELHVFQRLRLSTVARKLGKNYSTVQEQYERAMKNLEKYLEE